MCVCLFCFFYSFQMAEQQVALAITQMHSVALTIAEVGAILALALAHPFAIAIRSVAILPDVHKIVLVDVALIIVGADAGAGSYGAVGHYGAYADACLTGEEAVAHLTLVVAQKALATVIHSDAPFLARTFYKIKDTSELLTGEPHIGVLGGSAHREDGEEPPALYALADEEFLYIIELGVVTTVHAGYYVEEEALLCHQHIYGFAHHLKALLVAPHPIVVFL